MACIGTWSVPTLKNGSRCCGSGNVTAFSPRRRRSACQAGRCMRGEPGCARGRGRCVRTFQSCAQQGLIFPRSNPHHERLHSVAPQSIQSTLGSGATPRRCRAVHFAGGNTSIVVADLTVTTTTSPFFTFLNFLAAGLTSKVCEFPLGPFKVTRRLS